MTLDEASHSPLEIVLAGRKWLVKPRPLAELGELQSWFRREIPSPLTRTLAALEQAKRQGVSTPEWLAELSLSTAGRAELAWPPRIGSWHWLDAVDQCGKQAYVVRFALLPLQPDMTEADAQQLVENAAEGEIGRLARVLFDGELPGPKDQPGTSPASPTQTTTTDPSPNETTGAAGSATSP